MSGEKLPYAPFPATPEGVAAFLESDAVPGIGAAYAKRIVQAFGLEAVGVLAKDPDRVASSVAGLGAERAEKASAALAGLSCPASVYVALYSAGVGQLMTERILSHYGKRTAEVLLSDPYAMVGDVWQLSFRTADKIGHALGIAADDPRRLRASLVWAVRLHATEGHLFALPDEAVERAVSLCGAGPREVAAQIETAVSLGNLIFSRGGLYLPVFYRAERDGAAKLRALARTPREAVKPEDIAPSDGTGIVYTHEQRSAVAMVASSSVSVLTGGPGTGKTTVLRGLLGVLRNRGEKVVLCAPTGRAAKRMSTLTGAEASTIHRLLGWRSGGGRKPRPIEADTIIIDEGSMMEQVLFDHLLDAIKPGTRVVMVGDADQLPAIGAGNVLRDLIESGAVPVTRLEGNFRQQKGSGIAAGANAVNRGELPDMRPGGELVLEEEQTPRAIHDRILQLVAEELPAKRGIKSSGIIVVTPQQIGPLGARVLNADLQERLNPQAPAIRLRDRELRLGDPVMQTANSSERGIYNGETGRITAFDPDARLLEVTYPDGRKSQYSGSELSELTLAYATTVHKLQGSEVPYVVMPISIAHKPMLYRNLLYTALSRASRLCVLVGEPEALEYAVANNPDRQRRSNFGARLLETSSDGNR